MQEPKDIFKKFGSSARHILMASQKIAQNMNSGIGSEHILLAMTVTSGNLAYDILKDNAISLDQVKLVLNLNNIRTNINKGISKEVKSLLVIAAKKTNKLKLLTIESEHLLWAILDDKNCRANQIINRIGVEPKDIKEQLDDIFQEINNSDQDRIPGDIGGFNMMNFGGMPPNKDLMFTSNQFSTEINKKNKKTTTPLLDQFGQDLTDMAKKGTLDPVIGRHPEITRAIQILSRRNKNNPVLVGEPGVGKTAIVEGLAQMIQSKKTPAHLNNKRIVSLDLSLVIAGTMYRGQFEDRLKKILAEIYKAKNIILFIDEIHTIVGAGSAEGSMDTANILKPALAKGQIHLIGSTTSEEYRKYIEKDKALERRLQMIKVLEPSENESIEILNGIKSKYEKHHQIGITNEAILAAVKMSKRYITDRFLPDKAIDLIDEAAAAKSISQKITQTSNKNRLLQKQLEEIITKKEEYALNQDYKKAAEAKTKEEIIKQKLKKLQSKPNSNIDSITHIDIAQVVSMWTSIPIDNLITTEQKKLLDLEKILSNDIVGQDEAISTIAQAIRRSKSGIANPNRPIGAFIFLGPTGVGKTELAKVLARVVYANENALIKIDMSEFSQKHTIARLVGAPPGYVGYEDAGKLTEAVRKQPYSVILLDEIEKAHPEIFNILLQIMEDGYLTDAKGKRVNFRNTIIILTSNIGVQELTHQAVIGFQSSVNENKKFKEDYQQMKQTVLDQLKHQFRPELLNRLDKIIVFKPLDKASILKIVDLQFHQLINRLKEQNVKLEVDEKVHQYLGKVGFNPEYGARPIRRKISELIEDPLSDALISGKFKEKDHIRVSIQKSKITLHKK